MKKNLSRMLNNPQTVGELINQLKANFYKDDDIIYITTAIIPHNKEIDVAAKSAQFTLHSSCRTVLQIAENRKARKEKENGNV